MGAALSALRESLNAHTCLALKTPFAEPDELRRFEGELIRRYGDASNGTPPTDSRAKYVSQFLSFKRAKTPRELKWLCYGLSDFVGTRNESILADRAAFNALIQLVVDVKPSERLFRKCYLGLMHAYFAFDGLRAQEGDAKQNWGALRLFLASHLVHLTRAQPSPAWVQRLQAHSNLFTDRPCDRYAAKLLQGDRGEFDEMRQHLDVSQTSWVCTESLLSAVTYACSGSDSEFVGYLDAVLGLLKGDAVISEPGLAAVLHKYSELAMPNLHIGLRDYSISLWGSPLLRQNERKWHVAGEKATHMVGLWLKSRLIQDFFELLSADGKTDKSRVRFWQRYVRSISDIYFALGREARSNNDPDFIQLRKTMGTSLLRLENVQYSNNAFIMVMNGFVVMEFGEKGNASFIFDRDHLPFELNGSISGSGRSDWRYLARMLHLQRNARGTSWEAEFERELRKVVGVEPDGAGSQTAPSSSTNVHSTRVIRATVSAGATPSQRRQTVTQWLRWTKPQLEAVRAEAAQFGVWVMHKPQDQTYVVMTRDSNQQLNEVLKRHGFTYDSYGFWHLSDKQ